MGIFSYHRPYGTTNMAFHAVEDCFKGWSNHTETKAPMKWVMNKAVVQFITFFIAQQLDPECKLN
jgi:hypothetical protein